MIKLQIEDLNENTVSKYKSCFDKNGSPKNTDKIKWQFFNNPEKKSIVSIASINNDVAAIYAVSCIRFKVGDNVFLGSQSMDTITDIEYRGKGLFIKLANDVYQKAKASEVTLVYGFPNGNSIYGFKKKLDWNVLDPLPFMIKPLQSKYFTNKIKFLKFLPNFKLSFFNYNFEKKYNIKENFNFPDEVNRIWEIFSQNIEVAVVRNKSYLEWRYLDKPNENYKILHCYSETEKYLGFIVYTIKEKHGGKIAYIMELLYDLKKPKVGHELLNYAINKIKEEKADSVLAWCLEHSPNYNVFRKSSFFKLPEKLRPIELHFGVCSFNKKYEELIENRNSWYISYSDSDTV